MKRAALIIQISMLIVSSVVGAGFASGKEILLFFGKYYKYRYFLLFALWALFSFSSFVFLKLGIKLKPKDLSFLHRECFSKASWAADLLVLFNCVVVGGGMLAAMNTVGIMLFPGLKFPLFALLSVITVFFILLKGAKGLLTASTVLAPLIMIFLIVFSIKGMKGSGSGTAGQALMMPLNAVVYVCMNILLAGGTMSTLNLKDNKAILPASIAGGGIVAVLVFLILSALTRSGITEGEMPVMTLVGQYSAFLRIAFSVVMILGIFTTLLSAVYSVSLWMNSLIKSRALSIGAVLFICFLVSLAGFSAIVDYLYPVFGALGVVYVVVSSVRVYSTRPLFCQKCGKVRQRKNTTFSVSARPSR